jgi:hypothetical protein
LEKQRQLDLLARAYFGFASHPEMKEASKIFWKTQEKRLAKK